MRTSDVQIFARALYETLMSSTIKQLRTAESKLTDVNENDPELQKRIRSALPTGTPAEVRNFLITLIREGAFGQLNEIIQSFERYGHGEDEVVLDAEVTSAVPLSAEQQERITHDLQQRYNQALTVAFKVDESLIGGLIIRVGDQVLDNSLRVRLSAVQRNMLSS